MKLKHTLNHSLINTFTLKHLPLILIFLFVNLVSAQTPEPVPALKALHWHPDSARIAVGYADGRVEVIAAATSEVLFTFSDADGSADNVLWSHDGSKFAAGIGKKIYIWDAENYHLLYVLTGHEGAIGSLTWILDDTELVSVNYIDYSTLKFWNAQTGQLRLSKPSSVGALSWDKNQNRLAAIDPLNIVLIDPLIGEYTNLCDKCGSDVASDMDWSPDGNKIAAATRSYIAFRDPQAANQSGIDGNGRSFYSIAWSPNSLYLASGDSEGQVQIWNVETLALVYEIATQQDAIYAVDWSPDGTRLAYGGTDGRLTVSASIVSRQSEGEQLRELLTGSSCQKACYLGIEPGNTTVTELENILTTHGIAWEYNEVMPGANPDGLYYWSRPIAEPFQGDSYFRVQATVSDSIIVQLILPINVDVDVIVESLGSPDKITDAGQDNYYILYVDQRLAFQIDAEKSSEYASFLYLADPSGERDIVVQPIAPSIMENCPTYGTPPCIVPTATPMP